MYVGSFNRKTHNCSLHLSVSIRRKLCIPHLWDSIITFEPGYGGHSARYLDASDVTWCAVFTVLAALWSFAVYPSVLTSYQHSPSIKRSSIITCRSEGTLGRMLPRHTTLMCPEIVLDFHGVLPVVKRHQELMALRSVFHLGVMSICSLMSSWTKHIWVF